MDSTRQLKLRRRFLSVFIGLHVNQHRSDADSMHDKYHGTLMTSSADTWRPLLAHTDASYRGELPFPVYDAELTSSATLSRGLQVLEEPQSAPLDLCKPRRSSSPAPPIMSTTHDVAASIGKYSCRYSYENRNTTCLSFGHFE